MKITAIKQQVKRPDRYSIYIDEKYHFSLGESEMLAVGVRVGMELSADDLDRLQYAAVFDKAYDRVLSLIARRPRSEWEVTMFLRRKQIEPSVSDAVVQRLRKRAYLDDEQFARAWVQSRRLLKPTSKRKLSYELKAKGVSEDVITSVLAEDEVSDKDELMRLVEKKRRIGRYVDDQKLMAYLLRQGYTYQDVRAVLQPRGGDSEGVYFS